MTDRVAAAVKNYRQVQAAHEKKQVMRKSLQTRKAEHEQVREAQELALAETKNAETIALDGCARGETPKLEYERAVERRAAAEVALAETASFITSIENQLSALDSEALAGSGPLSCKTLTGARQDVFKAVFADLASEIPACCLPKLQRAFCCFFLMGGSSDWRTFIIDFVKLVPPTQQETNAMMKELETILEQ